jgi:hypothetical protein
VSFVTAAANTPTPTLDNCDSRTRDGPCGDGANRKEHRGFTSADPTASQWRVHSEIKIVAFSAVSVHPSRSRRPYACSSGIEFLFSRDSGGRSQLHRHLNPSSLHLCRSVRASPAVCQFSLGKSCDLPSC